MQYLAATIMNFISKFLMNTVVFSNKLQNSQTHSTGRFLDRWCKDPRKPRFASEDVELI